jgi:hypothetical protein
MTVCVPDRHAVRLLLDDAHKAARLVTLEHEPDVAEARHPLQTPVFGCDRVPRLAWISHGAKTSSLIFALR